MSRNRTILIVEDNELSLKMAKGLLQRAGYNTLEAHNAELGGQLARKHQPDLILMDIHLPVKSGYEASRELKADPETQAIPIIAFTALAMKEEQKKAMAHGCCGVISKPIDIKSFTSTVESFLKQKISAPYDFVHATPQRENPSKVSSGVADCTCDEKIDQIQQDLEDFLLFASHDLQAPLRRIQRFARFLEKPECGPVNSPDEVQAYAKRISYNAKEMEVLLEGLLTLARVNQAAVPEKDISLDEVANKALRRHRNSINLMDAKVYLEELASLQADPEQMQWVFEELLENALKFHREDEAPQICIRGNVLNDNLYEITFQDNGIGFEAAHAGHIFKPFRRLVPSGKTPGKGLGLTIAKKIIERHHGSITAKSVPGSGTAITIHLPLKSPRKNPAEVALGS